ncbi:MAG: DUF5702 domain-containing protein [Anaerovoracaceae bacterium]
MNKLFANHIKNNKKGSLAVLSVMLFTVLAMAAVIFVKESARLTSASYCDSVIQLAGRSVLSEYHTDLKESYGIVAFMGYEKDIDEKLGFYLNETFGTKQRNGNFSMIKPKLNSVSVWMDDYSLLDADNFENQISEYAKLSVLTEKQSPGKNAESSGRLINHRIINELPSRYLEKNGFSALNIFDINPGKWSDIVKNTSEALLTDKYILDFCNCSHENAGRTETFFQNEIEYILYGKLDDEQNKKAFMRQFGIFRVAMNTEHILSDRKKMTALAAAAEALTPGPEAEITKGLLVVLWAELEASNDKNLLLQGEGVALYKTDGDWAVNIDSVIKAFEENTGSEDGTVAIRPEKKSNMTYKQYLKLFLACSDRKTKLVRLMDIIQINMQGSFDENFRIKDMYTGFKFCADISGQEFEYVEKY